MIYSTNNYFSYVSRNIDIAQKSHYEVQIPPFTDKQWQRLNENTTSSVQSDSVIVKPNLNVSQCPYIRFTLKNIGTFENVKVTQPTSDSTIYDKKTLLYVDIYYQKTVFLYAANTNLGTTTTYSLNRFINESDSVTLGLFLKNEGSTPATFSFPSIIFYSDIHIPLTPVFKDEGQSTTKMTITITPEMGEIDLYSMFLFNPHKSRHSDLNYQSSEVSFASIPMISNSTHILGFDIYDYRFIHIWKIKTFESYYVYTMSICPIKTFSFSMYLIQTDTTNWYDAMEKWHLRFPDIYSEQIGGEGRWAAFPTLQTCFPNSTEDRDIYGVQFQWGASNEEVKSYIPSYFYYECALIHIGIPFNSETLISDLTKCSQNLSYPFRKNCEYLLNYAPRDINGNIKGVYNEQQDWNHGLAGSITLQGEYLQAVISKIKSVLDGKIENNIHFSGLAWDSFTTLSVDYISETHKDFYFDIIPYSYICGNGHKCIPFYAFYFGVYNEFIRNETNRKRYWPLGLMTNAIYQPQQLVQFSALTGYETKLSKNGQINMEKFTWDYFWGQRFSSGSRPLSHLDNVERQKAYNVKEEYFSIMLTFGSAASYFSQNAYKNNFFANCTDLYSMKEHFRRWNSITKEVLDGTIFYANQKGRVTMTMDPNEQNPTYNPDKYEELSTKTLFCKKNDEKGTCYLNVFLGYHKNHSAGSDFVRKANIIIQGNHQKCIFTSNEIKCYQNSDGSFTVEMSGTQSGHTYQIAVIQFDDANDDPDNNEKESNNKKAIIGGVIGAIVGIIIIVTVVVVVIIIRKRTNNSSNATVPF